MAESTLVPLRIEDIFDEPIQSLIAICQHGDWSTTGNKG